MSMKCKKVDNSVSNWSKRLIIMNKELLEISYREPIKSTFSYFYFINLFAAHVYIPPEPFNQTVGPGKLALCRDNNEACLSENINTQLTPKNGLLFQLSLEKSLAIKRC